MRVRGAFCEDASHNSGSEYAGSLVLLFDYIDFEARAYIGPRWYWQEVIHWEELARRIRHLFHLTDFDYSNYYSRLHA
jgi:hypothetical protein